MLTLSTNLPSRCAGDEQSLSASLSTFSGHLRRIGALRQESSSKSLVLLDEVGTGGLAEDTARPGVPVRARHAAAEQAGRGSTEPGPA